MFMAPFKQTFTFGANAISRVGIRDLAVGKIGSNGTLGWMREFGAPGADLDVSLYDAFIGRMFVAPNGESTLFFDLGGTVDIGSGALAPVGGKGVVIAHLAP